MLESYDNGWEKRLADALVIQAAKDYMFASHAGNDYGIASNKRFFNSRLCNLCTEMEGKDIIKRLDELVEEQKITADVFIKKIKDGEIDISQMDKIKIAHTFREWARKNERPYHRLSLKKIYKEQERRREK